MKKANSIDPNITKELIEKTKNFLKTFEGQNGLKEAFEKGYNEAQRIKKLQHKKT